MRLTLKQVGGFTLVPIIWESSNISTALEHFEAWMREMDCNKIGAKQLERNRDQLQTLINAIPPRANQKSRKYFVYKYVEDIEEWWKELLENANQINKVLRLLDQGV